VSVGKRKTVGGIDCIGWSWSCYESFADNVENTDAKHCDNNAGYKIEFFVNQTNNQ